MINLKNLSFTIIIIIIKICVKNTKMNMNLAALFPMKVLVQSYQKSAKKIMKKKPKIFN